MPWKNLEDKKAWEIKNLDKRKKYHREYHIANKDKINSTTRSHHFQYRYGITIEQLSELIKTANNKCQICGSVFSKINKPHVDHDHKTKVIRGILCRNCNTGIGMLRDSPKILKLAIEYLK